MASKATPEMEPIMQSEESPGEMVDLLRTSSSPSEPAEEPPTVGEVTLDSGAKEEVTSDAVDEPLHADGSCEVGLRPWIARRYIAFEEKLAQASQQRVEPEANDGAGEGEDTDDGDLNVSHGYKPSWVERCFDLICEAYMCEQTELSLCKPGNKFPRLKQSEKFASVDLRKARAHGLQTIMGVIRNPYTPTCFGAFFRDFSVYGFFLLSFCLWCNVLGGVIYDLAAEDDKQDNVYRLAKLIFSTFAWVLAIADLVHHTSSHEYLTRRECANCEDDSNSDTAYGCCKCPRCCPVLFDGARLLLVETVNYPILLLSIFQLIVHIIEKEGRVDATTCISVILTSLVALFHVYLARWFVLAGSIFSLQKMRSGGEKVTCRSLFRTSSAKFHVAVVLNAVGHTIVQMMMIAAIGTRFNHEYRSINSTNSDYYPSPQLWYMMLFAYIYPFLGVVMFLVTCHFWSQQFPIELVLDMLKVLQRPGFVEAIESQKRKDDFSSTMEMRDSSYLNEEVLSDQFGKVKDEGLFDKLAYPFKSPFHILLCLIYCGFVIAFGVCTFIDGPSSNGGIAFYALAVLYAIFVNGYAFAIVSVWVIVFVTVILTSVVIIIGCIVICVCGKIDPSTIRRNVY